jgi:hypothetical protein
MDRRAFDAQRVRDIIPMPRDQKLHPPPQFAGHESRRREFKAGKTV